MPTGYTYPVAEGEVTDFAEFAMQCARAFGALITMRDDPADAPIPEEFKPSDYNQTRLDECRARLAEIQAMTTEQVAAAAMADYQAAKASHDKHQTEQELADQRLDLMLEKVRAWTPPTAEHQGLKDFMIQQLTDSKRSDFRLPPPLELSAVGWQRQKIEELHKDIGYHAGAQAREIERAKTRTAWVRALRSSLQPSPNSAAA